MARRFAFVIGRAADLSSQWPCSTLRPLAALPPLGVLTLAAVLKQEGWDVALYDNSLEQWAPERLLAEVLAFEPAVAGLSMTSLSAPASMCLGQSLAREGVRVLAGGPHVSVLPQEASRSEGVWAAVAGEAEGVIVELAEAAVAGSMVPLLPGVYSRGTGNGVTAPPMDLDVLPRPARELIDLQRYHRSMSDIADGPVDSLATSRGCPFRCAFCANPGTWSSDYRRHRTRSASRVADEMEHLAERYGSKGFFFREDNITPTRRHIEGLCDEFLRRRFAFGWKCEAHVSTVDEALLEKMARAGLKTLWLGLESGSDRILRTLGKGFTADRAKQLLLHAKRLGLRTTSSFLLGLPDQTEEDILLSVRLAEEGELDEAWFNAYIGYPGAPLYEQVQAQGLVEGQWHSILIPRSGLGDFAAAVEWENRMREHFRARARARRDC